MNLTELPSQPLTMDGIHDLQDTHLCTPLFFLPHADTDNDIILFATTEDGTHTHIAFNPDTDSWEKVGFVEVGESLDDSNTMAFSLFSDSADWIDTHYDRDNVAMFDEQSAHQ